MVAFNDNNYYTQKEADVKDSDGPKTFHLKRTEDFERGSHEMPSHMYLTVDMFELNFNGN